MLRSRAYIMLLVVAAILGVPISAAAYGFLALVNYLQQELFTHLPHGLGLSTVPAWWPLPMLVIGGVLAGLAIRYLPGNGGASPAPGFGVHPPPTPVQLPGVILAALASPSGVLSSFAGAVAHLRLDQLRSACSLCPYDPTASPD